MAKNNANLEALRAQERTMEQAAMINKKAQRGIARICTHKDLNTGHLHVKQVGPDRVECRRCGTQFGLTPYPAQVIEDAARIIADQIELIRINTVVSTEKDTRIVAQLADTAANVRGIPDTMDKINKMHERKNNTNTRGRNNDHYGSSMDSVLGITR